MPVSVKRSGNLNRLIKKVEAGQNKKVCIGILHDSRLAPIATYLEFGWVQQVTDKQAKYFGAQGIHLKVGNPLYNPPRPFLRGTYAECKEKWARIATNSFSRDFDVERALVFVGEIATNDIKDSINQGGANGEKFADRSPMTMELYTRFADSVGIADGSKSTSTDTKPLYASGALYSAITYEIVE